MADLTSRFAAKFPPGVLLIRALGPAEARTYGDRAFFVQKLVVYDNAEPFRAVSFDHSGNTERDMLGLDEGIRFHMSMFEQRALSTGTNARSGKAQAQIVFAFSIPPGTERVKV